MTTTAQRDRRTRSRGTVWLLASRTARTLAQLAVLSLIARSSGAATAGEYALTLAISAPAFVLLDLGLRTVYLTQPGPPHWPTYVRVRSVSAALAVSATVAIIAVTHAAPLWMAAAVCLAKVSDLFIDLAYAPAMTLGRVDSVARPSMFSSLAAIVLVGLCLGILDNPPAAVLAFGFVSALTTATILMPCAWRAARAAAHQDAPNGTPAPSARTIVKAGATIGLASSLLSLTTVAPQYFLAAHFSTTQSGRYAVLAYLIVAAELLLNAYTQTWTAEGARVRRDEGDGALIALVTRSTRTLHAWWLIVCAASMAGAYVVVPLALGPSYESTLSEVLVIGVCIAALPTLFMYAAALQVLNKYNHGLGISLAATTVSLSACAVLVPMYGIMGALSACAATIAVRAAAARHQVARVSRER